jgi:hypothetical protein
LVAQLHTTTHFAETAIKNAHLIIDRIFKTIL